MRLQSQDRYHVIQRYVIIGDLDSLIEEMYDWSRQKQCPAHLLRFMAHLLLFFRTVGTSTKVKTKKGVIGFRLSSQS